MLRGGRYAVPQGTGVTAARIPPRPPFEHLKGVCAMCGGELAGRRRSWCSDACVNLWFLATDRGTQLRQLTDLQGQECWECEQRVSYPSYHQAYRRNYRWYGMQGPPKPVGVRLEVDHVRPLWSLTDPERLELRWWLPFNLQLLCRSCHAAKTKREAGDRAAARRHPSAPSAPVLQLVLDLPVEEDGEQVAVLGGDRL